jgi:hypothetical protein
VGCSAVAGGGRRWSSGSGAVGPLCGGAARLWAVASANDRGGKAGLVPSRPGRELAAATTACASAEQGAKGAAAGLGAEGGKEGSCARGEAVAALKAMRGQG